MLPTDAAQSERTTTGPVTADTSHDHGHHQPSMLVSTDIATDTPARPAVSTFTPTYADPTSAMDGREMAHAEQPEVYDIDGGDSRNRDEVDGDGDGNDGRGIGEGVKEQSAEVDDSSTGKPTEEEQQCQCQPDGKEGVGGESQLKDDAKAGIEGAAVDTMHEGEEAPAAVSTSSMPLLPIEDDATQQIQQSAAIDTSTSNSGASLLQSHPFPFPFPFGLLSHSLPSFQYPFMSGSGDSISQQDVASSVPMTMQTATATATPATPIRSQTALADTETGVAQSQMAKNESSEGEEKGERALPATDQGETASKPATGGVTSLQEGMVEAPCCFCSTMLRFRKHLAELQCPICHALLQPSNRTRCPHCSQLLTYESTASIIRCTRCESFLSVVGLPPVLIFSFPSAHRSLAAGLSTGGLDTGMGTLQMLAGSSQSSAALSTAALSPFSLYTAAYGAAAAVAAHGASSGMTGVSAIGSRGGVRGGGRRRKPATGAVGMSVGEAASSGGAGTSHRVKTKEEDSITRQQPPLHPPKRPLSAKQLYTQQRRPILKKMHPVSQTWKQR